MYFSQHPVVCGIEYIHHPVCVGILARRQRDGVKNTWLHHSRSVQLTEIRMLLLPSKLGQVQIFLAWMAGISHTLEMLIILAFILLRTLHLQMQSKFEVVKCS